MSDLGWLVYIIENERGVLYTGITTSLRRRFAEHRSTRGARFFRFGRPARVVYTEVACDRSGALRREAEIKRLHRAAKLALIAAQEAVTP
jgi:putative endonuclease